MLIAHLELESFLALLPHGHQAGWFEKAPQMRVADCLVQWGSDKNVGRATVAEWKPSVGIKIGWDFVSQRAFIPYRAFLVGAGNWTAFFDNHSREFLPQAELFVLCQRLVADTCFFRCTGDESEIHFCYFRHDGSAVRE